MSKTTRIDKWREYREEIDSNKNIHFSIVNSDDELKQLFDSINFNIVDSYKKAGYVINNKSYYHSNNKSKNEIKNIKSILRNIEENENMITKKNLNKDFNSHKYDEIINNYFLEFIDRKEWENKENQETIDLKINKINIVESKEK